MLFYFVFEGNQSKYKPPGGLYLEGRFNGGFFASPIWGAYIWRGLYMEGLIFGLLRYAGLSPAPARFSHLFVFFPPLKVSRDPGLALFEGRDSRFSSKMRVRFGIESMQGMRDAEITIRITGLLKEPYWFAFPTSFFFSFVWQLVGFISVGKVLDLWIR